MRRPALLCLLLLASTTAVAETAGDFLTRYEREAGPADVARGRQFYLARPRGEWSCATCHTENPTQPGRHAKTDKPIAPLAPAADAQRFRETAKVDKWFRRNCNDVLGRECNAREKADVMAFLLAAK